MSYKAPDRRTKAGRLYSAGLEEYQREADPHLGLLRGIARMLADSNKKLTKKEEKEKAPLAFTPKALFEKVRAECPTICTDPYNKAWFGWMGKSLHNVSSLKHEDMQLFVDWINSGALQWMKQPADFGMVARKFPDWISMARRWAMENNRNQVKRDSAFK